MRVKRLMLSLIAALVLAGAASTILKSHALLRSGQSGMASIQDMQTGQTARLPEQDIQDRSVLFGKEPAP
ncbi:MULTISPECIES: hypothetical protein [Bradyrhizobium]|uniref:Uncharacterized protein n=1 Tax=Bradyrhizobium nanningense TaxID=1325118 RepID=A0A4Q0RUA7_9BRAD|nr:MULTISPECIES: hypothetical protein [Bradyrhizobium]RXH22260.1 hypothetical protein XH99_35370 [Bradyrhizobium nanningense]RXH28448.1 hypothetical protein XH84_26010 [Bradyrhizobium nanningense]TQF31206.1 hypothetical protein UNPA324_17495 [Bradyrhizobium sp. UNPA324]